MFYISYIYHVFLQNAHLSHVILHKMYLQMGNDEIWEFKFLYPEDSEPNFPLYTALFGTTVEARKLGHLGVF